MVGRGADSRPGQTSPREALQATHAPGLPAKPVGQPTQSSWSAPSATGMSSWSRPADAEQDTAAQSAMEVAGKRMPPMPAGHLKVDMQAAREVEPGRRVVKPAGQAMHEAREAPPGKGLNRPSGHSSQGCVRPVALDQLPTSQGTGAPMAGGHHVPGGQKPPRSVEPSNGDRTVAEQPSPKTVAQPPGQYVPGAQMRYVAAPSPRME